LRLSAVFDSQEAMDSNGDICSGGGSADAVDQYEPPFFHRTTTFRGFNTGLSGSSSSPLIAAIPAATYLGGLLKKDRYAQSMAYGPNIRPVNRESIGSGVLGCNMRRMLDPVQFVLLALAGWGQSCELLSIHG
jgi:hypothetical protein